MNKQSSQGEQVSCRGACLGGKLEADAASCAWSGRVTGMSTYRKGAQPSPAAGSDVAIPSLLSCCLQVQQRYTPRWAAAASLMLTPLWRCGGGALHPRKQSIIVVVNSSAS